MARNLHETYLYHITDVNNLPDILADGHLRSDSALNATKKKTNVAIGFSHIKERRRGTRVGCCGDKVVADFVPFYFCPRSPMLYTLNMGNVEGRPRGCQSTIVHLRTCVNDAVALGHLWAFSDTSAATGYPDFFDDTADLEKLDWDAIGAKYWSGRATQKGAEFLVLDHVPFSAFTYIGCFDDAVSARVNKLLSGRPNAPTVQVRRDWYYL